MCIVWSLTIFTVILLYILITKHFQYDSTTLFDCCPYSLWYYYAVWLLSIFSVILQCCFILQTRFSVILPCCLRTFFSVIFDWLLNIFSVRLLLCCLVVHHIHCDITGLCDYWPRSLSVSIVWFLSILWSYYSAVWLLTIFGVMSICCLKLLTILSVILLCCLLTIFSVILLCRLIANHIVCDIAMLFANHFQCNITVSFDC